jgi:hypothetical protein
MVEGAAVVDVERLITAINLQPKLGENTNGTKPRLLTTAGS